VRPARGIAAAVANDKEEGFRAVTEDVESVYWASVPRLELGMRLNTSSPTLRVVTLEPVETTVPERS